MLDWLRFAELIIDTTVIGGIAMILLDSFDSDVEAEFLKNILTKSSITFEEKKGADSYQLFINESDVEKVNELIKTLD